MRIDGHRRYLNELWARQVIMRDRGPKYRYALQEAKKRLAAMRRRERRR